MNYLKTFILIGIILIIGAGLFALFNLRTPKGPPSPPPVSAILISQDLQMKKSEKTKSVSISIEGTLPAGLSGGMVKINIPPELAEITQINFNPKFELTNKDQISLPASEITLQFADLTGDFPETSSNIHIADITLEVKSAGKGLIQLKVISPPGIQDFNGNEISLSTKSGQLEILD
jgi:hypothetical protein